MPLRSLSIGVLFVAAATAALLASGCSSSPMRSRLDKNFVYNCSLELIGKDVAAADAEKICTASLREELMEKEAKARETKISPPVPAAEPQRAPASLPVPQAE